MNQVIVAVLTADGTVIDSNTVDRPLSRYDESCLEGLGLNVPLIAGYPE